VSNLVTVDWPFITVLFGAVGDPESWDLTTQFQDKDPELVKTGVRLSYIQVIPSATNDAIVIRNTAVANQTSAKIMQEIAMSKYDIARRQLSSEGQHVWPAVHANEVTDGVILILEIIKT